MKDYEKAAIGIGVAALGFAAYQAHKTKQAADAVETTDPAKNPVTAAIDLSYNLITDAQTFFEQKVDEATGYVKGKAEDVVNTVMSVPAGVSYWITTARDYGRDATEAGSKYLRNTIAQAAANGKEKLEQLTNKPFTLMGALVTNLDVSRTTPKTSQPVADSLTGVGSKTETTERTTKQKIHNVMAGGFSIFRRGK